MNDAIELKTNSEIETGQLAASLSLYATPGDLFCLHGDLGTGKSVFARAFLQALSPTPDLEVPSPTFTLVQIYENLRINAAHLDLYRIEEVDEVDELGIEDNLIDGIALVEWPQRMPVEDFPDRLQIDLIDVSPQQRKLRLTGHGVWIEKLKRWHLSASFLKQAGWQDGERKFLQGDASSRRYERIQREGQQAVLMDMPQRSDGPIIRDGKPYSALAHLAEGVAPFIAMTNGLRAFDLSAPEIIASSPETGFLLLEDLGPNVFFDMAANGQDLTQPMQAAIDVLVTLSTKLGSKNLLTKIDNHTLRKYDSAALQIEIELLPDWYWPRLKKEKIPTQARVEFIELWQSLLEFLEDQPRIWTLRDYHSPNLIWLGTQKGVSRVGVIDYQDAVLGHPAYDLMSLLQDARRDVSADTEAELYTYYWEQMAKSNIEYDRQDFTTAYAILGAQRATKILGIFARLADRDQKPAYLAHMPRVQEYLARNLQHPKLAGLKNWFDHHLPTE